MSRHKDPEKYPPQAQQAGSREAPSEEADSGAQPSPSSTSQPPPAPKGHFDLIRENLEAIIVAFVLALIIRHFSVEAFEIPTGSMAPTLYGIHAWVSCPNCDTEFNFGLKSDQDTGRVDVPYQERVVYMGACPACKIPHHTASRSSGGPLQLQPDASFTCSYCNRSWKGDPKDFAVKAILNVDILYECPTCQFKFREIIEQSNHTGGHKILVNKFAYRIGKPERWDVIVFQFSEEKNYIKRLLGLPGETVSIRGGDLYTRKAGEDKLHIERKHHRPEVQQALWMKIADTSVKERGFNPQPAWKEVFERGSGLNNSTAPGAPKVDSQWWKWLGDVKRWTVNALQPEDRVAALKFNRECVDYYNYNLYPTGASRPMGFNQVGDKKVSFTVRPSKGTGWIGAEIRDGEFTFQLRIPVGPPSPERVATLQRLPALADLESPRLKREPGAELKDAVRTAPASLPLLSPSNVEFENVDDRAAVRINGQEVMSLEYDSGSPVLRAEDQYLLLLASNVAADFEDVRVFRDVYYTDSGNVADIHVASKEGDGENAFFPCGDNSPNSYDGRYWGTVPESNMMGKALLVFWPAWPLNWQCQFIR